ncbi:MAG: Arm DNA-binding domain-containing protein [Holophagaceae bacterium]|jgi:hypothetical protein|nr:Arm DNA-binding domain-containing protein [Holophagaceae bacterium]
MKLSDINIKRAKPTEKSYKLFDGNGLYLQVEPTGTKVWRYKYRFEGKDNGHILKSNASYWCHFRARPWQSSKTCAH